MRQHHAPGDKLFVDYAGATLEITSRLSGPLWSAWTPSSP